MVLVGQIKGECVTVFTKLLGGFKPLDHGVKFGPAAACLTMTVHGVLPRRFEAV